ncbi:MAG: DUF6064 family protein [Gemmatimonadales bacterium]
MRALPFSHSQFLDVFAAYNTSLFPWIAGLWIASLAVVAFLYTRRSLSWPVTVLLAGLWLWGGIVYHLLYFARINPAARLFGLLFLVQAALLLGTALRRPLAYARGRSVRQVLGAVFLTYALLYPGLAMALKLSFPRTPTFGVPCPTVLLTTGFLLLLPHPGRLLLIIPLLWSLIGGSAAILLGMTPDYMLLAGAGVLLIVAVRPGLIPATSPGPAA